MNLRVRGPRGAAKYQREHQERDQQIIHSFKAMKPPASNGQIITCFMTVLLGLQWQSVSRNSASFADQCFVA